MGGGGTLTRRNSGHGGRSVARRSSYRLLPPLLRIGHHWGPLVCRDQPRDAISVFVISPGFVLDGEAIFGEFEVRTHQAGSWTSLHRVAHGMEPSQRLVVDIEPKVTAPQVGAPIANTRERRQKLHLGGGPMAFG